MSNVVEEIRERDFLHGENKVGDSRTSSLAYILLCRIQKHEKIPIHPEPWVLIVFFVVPYFIIAVFSDLY